MSATDTASLPQRGVFYDRRDPDLMLSTGNPPTDARPYPQRLSFFRAKAGRENQWGPQAVAFNKVYDVELQQDTFKRETVWTAITGPKRLVIRFPSDDIADVLDVRYLAFGQGRLAAKGDTNYVTVPTSRHFDPEWITSFPLDGPSERFQIAGPDDPLCQGGQYDIPVDTSKGKPTGKPTLFIHASLSFTLVDVGALSSVTQYQTGSISVRSRLWKDISWWAQHLAPLSSWLFELRGKPGRRSYHDAAGKRHTTETWDPYIVGPLDPETREPVTLAQARQAALDARAERLQLPPASPVGLPSGGWVPNEPELLEGEVVEDEPRNPDDDIPFGGGDE